MNLLKKHKNYNIEQATIYTFLALILLILGIIKINLLALIAAIIVGACASYWIWVAKK